ncbi:hypothetical protein ABZX65_26875 [Streptomyces sp. NPDC003300]|uniref:hypothetical protein n=1 Tax=unclassified Streptomyces TaxID=2593676 RepID=UPI0033A20697
MSKRKRIAPWSTTGAVGFLVLMFIIGTVGGPAKKNTSAEATPSPSVSSSPSPVATVAPATTAAPAKTAVATTKAPPPPKPKPTRTGCGPIRDVIIWMRVPDLPDGAQVVGNWNQADCRSTFDTLPDESPTGPGFCTEAAWVSDNPGYDADATPAKRPKKVQVSAGPAC